MRMADRGPASAKGALLCLLVAMATRSAPAQAPTPPNPFDGWDNAYYQIMADELRRIGMNRTVYSSDGHAVGRIVDVRTTPDGMHEATIVRVRRLMGGGEIALPLSRLAKRNGRLVARDDRGSIRSMNRLAIPDASVRR